MTFRHGRHDCTATSWSAGVPSGAPASRYPDHRTPLKQQPPPIHSYFPMTAPTKSGGELFIVDNSDETWKGLRYLQDWTEIASAFDIATGFFEIGSLLALDGRWQKLDRIRILMGGQASARTKQAILEGLRQHVCQKLDSSLENEKESNGLLAGAAAIVQAMRHGKIQCRVY